MTRQTVPPRDEREPQPGGERLVVRQEIAGDAEAIEGVLTAAFGQDDEARLVRALRREGAVRTSLVACLEETVVGHILFTDAHIETEDGGERVRVAALGPMAVAPAHQRKGIGGRLIEAGLASCRTAGETGVIVLGHADYYPRFGFEPAARYALRCEFDVPPEVFMALPLVPGALDDVAGLVRYHPAFHLGEQQAEG